MWDKPHTASHFEASSIVGQSSSMNAPFWKRIVAWHLWQRVREQIKDKEEQPTMKKTSKSLQERCECHGIQ
jgi:hypothetical protein